MNLDLPTQARAAARRPLHAALLSALLSALCLAGCGGAGPGASEAASSQAVASVRLEGCVVDALWLSAPGVAVHARGTDGRALGTAITDSRGVFQMTVPARTGVVVDTAVGGTGGMVLDTGSTPLTVAGCLASSV